MLMMDWFTAGTSKKPRPSRPNFKRAWQSAAWTASGKNQDRLLQGQKSHRSVSERPIRLSRILLSTAAGEEVPGTHTVLRLQPSGQSLGAESHALDDPRLGHPTSNTAVVGRCRPADQSPPTGLDCILRTIRTIGPVSLAPIHQSYASGLGDAEVQALCSF